MAPHNDRDHPITTLITRVEAGDLEAARDLVPELYDVLRRLAGRQMSREASGHTLQATALVNEAYLRVVGDQDAGWSGRGHFYGAAAQAMRRILIEHARRRGRVRHGGGRRPVELDGNNAVERDAGSFDSVDLLALDEALTELEGQDPRAAQIVLLRYFAGLGTEEVAAAMDLSDRTVRREWSVARLWLYERMSGAGRDTE